MTNKYDDEILHHEEHKCKELPKYIIIFLDVYARRWRSIDENKMNWKWVNYCSYCGVKLQQFSQREPI